MKKKDIYIQDDASSCGARCIQSIVSFYDGYVPLELVLEDTNTNLSGTTAYDCIEALKKYGFDAYGVRINIEKIDNSRLPSIAHTVKEGYEHFLVIYEIKDNEILTMDPECGKKVYSKEEFKTIFTGALIIITPIGKIPKYKKSKSLFKSFIPILKRMRYKILLVFSLSITLIIFNISIGFHLKVLNKYLNDPIKITLLFIILQIFSSLITLLKEVWLEKMTKTIDEVSLGEFTTHIFKLPIRYLHNKRVGEILKKIEDMTFIKDILLRITIKNSIDFLTIIISIPLLLVLSKPLTIIYSITLLLYALVTLFTQKYVYRNEKKYLKTYNNYQASLVEYLESIESIKNLNTTDYFLKDINTSLKNHTKARFKGNLVLKNLGVGKDLLFQISVLLINLIGFLSINESFTFIDLMTYETILSLVYISFESIIETFVEFMKGKAIFNNICEFIDLEEEKNRPKYSIPFKNINIKNTSFSYDKIHYTIKDFNYNIKKGDKILINGPSGIGKSTLVKCLCGRLDNYEGEILLNDISINSIGVDSLRNYVIYIGQEEHLFRKSILENVTLGIPDTEKFLTIANLTLLDEVISKRTDKENTTLLEGASNFSGGEKARIILARALYKKPSVLIIDETLSSVSEAMENTILNNLLSIEDLTLIYITHRNKEKFFDNIITFRKDGTYETNDKRTSSN